ncbi:hypothetical protein CPLU01_00412 [Colletotrichum plurivorum]|uniref:Uncharacterized protein n=1 Tax=Colletotrichum plurivorum TaxID=2175906 RepID=A0A8H6U6H9_9PEZI|nr:hypothetical protein CPLU01_00412 [Colletotrichum plurivorum]
MDFDPLRGPPDVRMLRTTGSIRRPGFCARHPWVDDDQPEHTAGCHDFSVDGEEQLQQRDVQRDSQNVAKARFGDTGVVC